MDAIFTLHMQLLSQATAHSVDLIIVCVCMTEQMPHVQFVD